MIFYSQLALWTQRWWLPSLIWDLEQPRMETNVCIVEEKSNVLKHVFDLKHKWHDCSLQNGEALSLVQSSCLGFLQLLPDRVLPYVGEVGKVARARTCVWFSHVACELKRLLFMTPVIWQGWCQWQTARHHRRKWDGNKSTDKVTTDCALLSEVVLPYTLYSRCQWVDVPELVKAQQLRNKKNQDDCLWP